MPERLILFFPRHATSFAKMLPQCEFLASQSEWQPKMVLADRRTYGYDERCRQAGIATLNLTEPVLTDPVESAEADWQTFTRRFPAKLGAFLLHERVAHGLLVGLWRRNRVIRGYSSQLNYWVGVLTRLRPAAVMMPGDRELGFIPPLLKAARQLQIPAIICTSNIPTLNSVAAMRAGRLRFATEPAGLPPVMNLLAARQHPDQISRTPHGCLLFSPGWLISALHHLSMLSARPWTQGGGNSSHVILDGERKKRRFLELGAPAQKLQVIGDFTYDVLHRNFTGRRQVRQSLCESLALDTAQPIVVFAVPIFAEHNLISWDEHLRNLHEFSAALANSTRNVVLALHPKSPQERYDFLTNDFEFCKSDLPLAEILPAGDVFVCGNSSTIDWAILCEIPVVNIDYVGLHDTAFTDCKAVFKVATPKEFAVAFEHCLEDGDRLRRIQSESARDLSQFDGKAQRRYLNFLGQFLTP